MLKTKTEIVIPPALRARFFSKVNKTDGCWEWIGGLDGHGYGQLGVRKSKWAAHRVSWVVHNGTIPPNLHVLHHCDNPPCVRPDHLFLGTHLDNMADMVAKNRGCHSHGPTNVGVKNGSAKLTEQEVLEIRVATGNRKTLARKYGVCVHTVFHITAGRTWTHLK